MRSRAPPPSCSRSRWPIAFGFGPGTVAAAGLAAFIGHLYPVFFRCQGGKGVATAAGVLLALSPWLSCYGEPRHAGWPSRS